MRRALLFLLLLPFVFAQEVGYTRMGIYALREGEGPPSLYLSQAKALVKWSLEYGYKPLGPLRIEFQGVPFSPRGKFTLLLRVNIPGVFPPQTNLPTKFRFIPSQHLALSRPFPLQKPMSYREFLSELRSMGWKPFSSPFLYEKDLGELKRGLFRWAVPVKREGKAVVGIYSDRGAYHLGLIVSQRFFQAHGITYTPLYRDDLKKKRTYGKIKLLYFPGGWSGYYSQDLRGRASKLMREFIRKGGGYLGVCAGAYFASEKIIWEGEVYHPPLKIFPGVAIGPIRELAPWPLYTVADIIFLGEKTRAFYYGGPYFEGEGKVLATYEINGKPAVILSRFGQGKVLLSGLHFEYDLTGSEDGVSFPENEGLKTPRSTWPLFGKLLELLRR